MYYFALNEIISSLFMSLKDASRRAREYIVEISLDDAPVRVAWRLSVLSNLYRTLHVCAGIFDGLGRISSGGVDAGGTLRRSTKKNAMNVKSDWDYVECYPGMKVRIPSARQ